METEEGDWRGCVFCYKLHTESGGDLNLKRFLVMVQRYLKIPVKFQDILSEDDGEDFQRKMETPCELCKAIVTSFNELYHEMKCVELKINQNLGSLLDIMKDASKVDSRKRKLKQVSGKETFRIIAKRRKNWLQSCSQNLLKGFPVVRLEKMNSSGESQQDSVQQGNLDEFTNQWLLSLTAVCILLLDSSTPAVLSNDINPLEEMELEREETKERICNRNPVKKFEPEDIVEEEECETSEFGIDENLSLSSPRNDCQEPEERSEGPNVVTVTATAALDCGLCHSPDDRHQNLRQKGATCKIEVVAPENSAGPSISEENEGGPLVKRKLPNSPETMDDLSNRTKRQKLDKEDQPEETNPQSEMALMANAENTVRTQSSTEVEIQEDVIHAANINNDRCSSLSSHGSVANLDDFEIGEDVCEQVDNVTNNEEISVCEAPIATLENFQNCGGVPSSTRGEPNDEASTQNLVNGNRKSKSLPKQKKRKTPESRSKVNSSSQKTTRAVYNLRRRPAPKIAATTPNSDSEHSPTESDNEDEYKVNSSGTSGSDFSGSEYDDPAEIIPKPSKKRRPTGSISNSVEFNSFYLTEAQISELERAFQADTSLGRERRIELAFRLKSSEKLVQYWWSRQQSIFKAKSASVGKITDTVPSCTTDNCKFKAKKKSSYESHQLIHQSGTFSCQSCDTTLLSPFQLSLHEASEHSDNSSGLKYPCSRCQFKTCYQTVYSNHFATEHLKISGLPSVNSEVCPICKLDVHFPKRHFRIAHQTKGVHKKEIINCPEKGCVAIFINHPSYQRHLREYHKITTPVILNQAEPQPDLPKKCPDCNKIFRSKATFQKHKKSVHSKFICPRDTCKILLQDQDQLELHSKLHGYVKCDNCSFETDYLPEKMDHDIICLKLKTAQGYKCPDCDFATKFIQTLVDHRLETHLKVTGRIFKCSACSASFTRKDLRNRHFVTLHDKNLKDSFKCSECPAYFSKPIQLMYHKKHKHKKIFRWTCKLCGIEMSKKTLLTSHLARVHDLVNQPKAISCDDPECDKRFDNEEERVYHKLHWCGKIRKKKQPIPCRLCGKLYKQRAALKRHLKEHNTKTKLRWECDKCDKWFLGLRALQNHRHFHMDPAQWKYSCSVCSERFPGSDDLKRHLRRVHTVRVKKEENFECKDCKKMFNSRKNFILHRLQLHHTFRCPAQFCPYAFPDQKAAEIHSKLHGDYKCSKCQFKRGTAPPVMEHEIKCLQLKVGSRVKCPECPFIGKTSVILVNHRLETHLNLSRKVFVCEICRDSFSTVTGRSCHVKTHHESEDPEKNEICDKCPAYFVKKIQLEYHLKVCDGPNGRKESNSFCEMCGEEFRAEQEFQDHSKFHGNWKCQFCPVVETYAIDLAVHEWEEHRKRISNTAETSCSRCEWSTTENKVALGNFTKHFVSKHLKLGTKVYRCELCHRGYFTQLSLKNHIRFLHVGGRDGSEFKCDQCSAIFSRKIQLVLHRKSKHKEIHLVCKECNKRYKNEITLLAHIKRAHEYSQMKLFICDHPECEFSFETEDDLLIHKNRKCASVRTMKANQSETICPTCGKSCKSEASLKVHMHVHKTERPEKVDCDICGKTFKDKHRLQSHQEYHKGPDQSKFQCELCPKKSASKQKLEEHMRTHSKEKPFVCQVCGEKYAHNHNLRNHIKSKHKGVEVQVRKYDQRPGVSRKGKKLGKNFCFTRDKDLEDNEDSQD